MGSEIQPDKGRPRPRFKPADKNYLLSRLQLTAQQVAALERTLPSIADWLLPQAPGGSVSDELAAMAAMLEGAEALLRSWRAAPARSGGAASARAEAFGHFNVAAGPLVRGSAGLDLHDDLDPASIITMLAYISRKAANASPGQGKRRSRVRASPQAVGLIVDALHRPADEYSRARALALKPSRGGAFLDLARVVWSAVLADANVLRSSPLRSIQEFCADPKRFCWTG